MAEGTKICTRISYLEEKHFIFPPSNFGFCVLSPRSPPLFFSSSFLWEFASQPFLFELSFFGLPHLPTANCVSLRSSPPPPPPPSSLWGLNHLLTSYFFRELFLREKNGGGSENHQGRASNYFYGRIVTAGQGDMKQLRLAPSGERRHLAIPSPPPSPPIIDAQPRRARGKEQTKGN